MTDEQLAIKWYEENKHLFNPDNVKAIVILAYMSGVSEGMKQAKDISVEMMESLKVM